MTLFLWSQAYKSSDKRVNFSWFYVTNFFPRFSDHSAEIHTERKVSCWKMTIRINWKMKEGVIVCFGDESNFSKCSKNSDQSCSSLSSPKHLSTVYWDQQSVTRWNAFLLIQFSRLHPFIWDVFDWKVSHKKLKRLPAPQRVMQEW